MDDREIQSNFSPGDGERREDHASCWLAVTLSIEASQALAAVGLAHGSAIILSRGASISDEPRGREEALVTAADAAGFFVFGCDT